LFSGLAIRARRTGAGRQRLGASAHPGADGGGTAEERGHFPGLGAGAVARQLARCKPSSARRAAVVLAVSFLIAVAALRGLTATLPIFHGSDERTYHLPTILRFGEQLPWPDLAGLKAA
jgi:hypothetical protein